MIYSFDIFDTTLTRVVSNPRDIFFLIQNELEGSQVDLPDALRRHFPKMRYHAEMLARLDKKNEDVKFDEIYGAFARQYSLQAATIEFLKELELKIELQSCRPIAKTIIEINKARSNGARVIFTSDMYLPKDFIKKMLERVGAYQSGDGIYMSGETGRTKRSGNLFRHILKEEGIAACDLKHLGDHAYSDILIPSRLGVQVQRCYSQANRYEKTVRRSAKNDIVLRSLVAGASKVARLSSEKEDPQEKVIQEVSSSVIGPSFLFFVWWLLATAHQQGIRRLYFLSRDGEVLLKVARIINSHMKYDLDLRYLHTSREAWVWPAIQEIGTFELSWILDLDDELKITLESISGRLGIKSSVLSAFVNQAGLKINTENLPLEPSQVEQLKSIFSTPGFLSLLRTRIDPAFQDTVGYLTQEGVFDNVPFALVDIGWRGTLQYALSKIMDKQGARPGGGLRGFYFGLENNEIKRYKNDRLDSFFIDRKREYLRNNVLFCEVFAASASSHTKGYAHSQGRYSAVSDDKNENPDQWGIGLQQESVLAFVSVFLSAYTEISNEPQVNPEILEKILRSFIFSPSVQEANVYGDFPLSVRFLEGKLTKFAPSLDTAFKGLPRTYWIPGTLVRSRLGFLTPLWQLLAYNPGFISACRQFYLSSLGK